MRSSKIITYIIVAAIILLILVFSGALYTVDETNQVVITQFGKPIGEPVIKAGLHLKVPFVQQANYFEKRLLEWDGNPTEISANDKVFIGVDTYARWRITDPLNFFRSVRNELGAQARLDNIIDAATRNFITSNLLIEVVRSTNRKMTVAETELEMASRSQVDSIRVGREKIVHGILEAASTKVLEYGIELVDVRIKRINYIEEVRNKVFERMIAERLRIAEKYRSEGQGKKAEIEGEMEKELQRITSEAYRKAQEIKGDADAEAVTIYAQAYEKDPEFYSFLKTLDTYKNTIDDKSWLILTTENDYLKYLKSVK